MRRAVYWALQVALAIVTPAILVILGQLFLLIAIGNIWDNLISWTKQKHDA